MAEKDKKRKRPETNGEKPHKKRATETSTSAPGNVKVSYIDAKEELHPVIASTPGLGFPAVPFKAYSKSSGNGKSDATPTPSSHSILLQSSKHLKLDYTATDHSDRYLSHYVGVYDPDTSSLKIIPAHPLILRSTLRSETAEVQAQNAARSFAQQRLELGMEFGTKKAKKAIASKTVNAITAETGKGVEAAVLESVQEASDALPVKQEQQDEVLANKPIPRPNLQADKIEDVYSLSTLVPQGDLKAILVKDWRDTTLGGNSVELSSRFVANRLRNVVERDDVQALKALKYLYLLLEFNNALRTGSRAGGKKVPVKDQLKMKLAEWPEGLVENVRRRFAEGGELNKWHVDNLMTHIAALSLYIENWKTDTHDLREDLRLENKQMSQYFHELGCKVAAPTEKESNELGIKSKAIAAQRRIAKLRIPLDFPKTRLPPRRR